MRIPLHLKINGGPLKTDRELKLKIGTLDLRNMEADEVQVQWIRKGMATCPLAEGDVVDLFIGPRRIFQGRVRLGNITTTGCALKLRGPWSHFEEYVYHHNLGGGPLLFRVGDVLDQPVDGVQVWDGGTWVELNGSIAWTVGYETVYDVGTPYVGTLDINRISTARMWFFPPGFSSTLSIQGQLTRLLTYFQSVTEGAFIDINPLNLGADRFPNYRTVQDVAVSEGLKQAVSAQPDASFWWDYSVTGRPEMHCDSASLEPSLELVPGAPDLPGYGLTPMDDLKVSGVVLRFEAAASFATGQGFPVWADAYPAETAGYERKVAVQTVGEDNTGAFQLAQPLYESLAEDKARGTVSVLDLDFSLGLRPGRVLEIPADGMLEGYKLWVQGVSWNPATGMASVTVGYPAILNLQQLTDLRLFLMRAFYAPGAGGRQIRGYTGA